MDLSNDEALLDEFRQTKDPVLFKSLVRRFQNRIYNSAYRILGNAEEAEEVVQETFMRMHQNINGFNRASSISLGAWIFRIAHNACMDFMRERARKKGHVSFDPQAADEPREGAASGLVTQVTDPSPGPSEKLDKREQTELVAEMLKLLPDSQRIVMVLHDVEGFSYQEIADIVGEKLGTVRSRIHYGREKMRELLEPYYMSSTISQTSR